MDATLEKKLLGWKQIAQEKLENIFAFIIGQKDIVIQPELIKKLENIVGLKWLRSKGIDKIYKFDPKNPPVKTKQIIYLISANLVLFKYVLDQISTFQKSNSSEDLGFKEYHIILVPNVLCSFKLLLEEEGLFDIVSLYRFNWDFISLDTGILSLEIPDLYKDLYIKNDTKLLSSVASSFKIFNMVHKKPNVVLAYGEYSEKIVEMVDRMENFRRTSVKDESKDFPDFTALILIDRNKDYPSCLLTPVIYSGLLLELFEFRAGYLTVKPENNNIKTGKLDFLDVTDKSQPETSKKEPISLRMGGHHDEIYSNNKFRHFADVINLLSVQSKSLGMESSKYSRSMNINEMKEYVADCLPKVAAQKKILFKHLVICEQIVQELGGNFEKLQTIEENMLTNTNKKQTINYLEEKLSTEAHKYNVLRLMCLYHITIGLQPDDTMKFITNYCNTFGYKYMTIFQALHTAKLFPDTIALNKAKIALTTIAALPKRTPFQIEMNKLKLIPSDASAFVSDDPSTEQSIYASSSSLASSASASPQAKGKKDASCPSYVFNGNFIPMIAQLASILLKSENFNDFNTKLGHLDVKLGGKLFGNSLKPIKDIMLEVKRGDPNNYNKALPLRPRTLFIFVVGGITYAEIAACNLVGALTGSKIVLASNAILSGEDVIKAAF